MTINGRWKSWKSSIYAALALGTSLSMAGAPAASTPAVAASAAGQADPSQLQGVFCTSAANCWAVGDHSSHGVTLNLVLHWTGKHWFGVAVPSPGGSQSGDSSELLAVRCTSASNCWAVGHTVKQNKAELDQALHWNGKKWLVVSTPTPAGVLNGDTNELNDVTCTSAVNCWAVGTYGSTMSTSTGTSVLALNQALHWNGKHWSLMPTPNPGGTSPGHGSVLNAVRCASAADCWAGGSFGPITGVGQATRHNQMLHWNGRKWAKVTVPNPAGTAKGSFNDILGLACSSAGNCFAAGFAGNLGSSPSTGKEINQILRWNGRKWFKQAIPQPGGGGPGTNDSLIGVTCSTARSCWAVGSRGHNKAGTPELNEALHWNGASWKLVSTPNPAGAAMDDVNILSSVRCTSAANCWTVGVSQRSGGQDVAELLHWTGRKWFVG